MVGWSIRLQYFWISIFGVHASPSALHWLRGDGKHSWRRGGPVGAVPEGHGGGGVHGGQRGGGGGCHQGHQKERMRW